DKYKAIATELNGLHADLCGLREEFDWSGEAASAARGVLDVLLTVLKYIAAIILFIVGALLLLVAMLLYAISALLTLIGVIISWVLAIIAVVVFLFVLVRTGGKASAGARLAAIWEALVKVFSTTRATALGII